MRIDVVDFSELRAQWALKHTPSEDRVRMERNVDQRANPHNEPYHNKRPRREEHQIVSDLCYDFADGVLLQQYGDLYHHWLKTHCDKAMFTGTWKQKSMAA